MSRNASVQSLGLQWLPGGVEDAPARIWSDFRHVDKKPDTWCVAIVLRCQPAASFSTVPCSTSVSIDLEGRLHSVCSCGVDDLGLDPELTWNG